MSDIVRTDWDTSSNRDTLQDCIRTVFDNTDREAVVEWKEVYNDLKTKKMIERDQQIAMLDIHASVGEGENIPISSPLFGGNKEYTQSGFGLGFRITDTMKRFNRIGLMKRLSRSLRLRMREGKDTEVAKLFNNASAVSAYSGYGFTSASSLDLAEDAQENLDGTTYDNYLDAGLSLTTIESARYYFDTLTDDRDQYMGGKPSHLVVNPYLVTTAEELLGSSGRPWEQSNTINAYKKMGLKIYDYHRLTATTSWFMIAKNDPNYDLNVLTSMEPIFKTKDAPDSTMDTLVLSKQYFDYGFGDPRLYLCGDL